MNQIKVHCVLFMLCVQLCLQQSHTFAQRQLYVDANNGNDVWDGTELRPWKTIQHAANEVTAGDTVFVRNGTYHEAVKLSCSGNSGNTITFKNYPNEKPVLDGKHLLKIGISITNAKHVRIEGFEIQNYEVSEVDVLAIGIEVRQGSSNIALVNNKIHGIKTQNREGLFIANGIGIYGDSLDPVSDILIEENELYDLVLGWSEALTLNGNVDGFEVRNNEIHDCNNIGIDMIGGEEFISNLGVPAARNAARNGIVTGNKVYRIDSTSNVSHGDDRGSAAGIYVDGGNNITIEQYDVYECNFGMSIGSEKLEWTTSHVIVRNNMIYRNHRFGLVTGGSGAVSNGGAEHNQILNNTLFQNGTSGEYAEFGIQNHVSKTVVKNNIFFADNDRIFIVSWDNVPSSTTIDFNIFFSSGTDADGSKWAWGGNYIEGLNNFKLETGTNANSRYVDPQFVDIANIELRIVDGSPAQNSGEAGLPVGSTDFYGSPRVSNVKVDIGAHELQGSPPPSNARNWTWGIVAVLLVAISLSIIKSCFFKRMTCQ